MTQIAVISDIHSNLESLTAVLADMAGQSVHRIICLGDNIGYGPDPEGVVRLLERHAVASVLGNHERAMMDRGYRKRLNPLAVKALEINSRMLSNNSRNYLSSLPTCLRTCGALFSHGIAPDRVSGYISRIPDRQLIRRAGQIRENLIFVGHTHELKIYRITDRQILCRAPRKVESISPDTKTIVNAGSVGQPREGGAVAAYVIWQPQNHRIVPRRVTYDARSTIRKIKQAGIPGSFAAALMPVSKNGLPDRWPKVSQQSGAR